MSDSSTPLLLAGAGVAAYLWYKNSSAATPIATDPLGVPALTPCPQGFQRAMGNACVPSPVNTGLIQNDGAPCPQGFTFAAGTASTNGVSTGSCIPDGSPLLPSAAPMSGLAEYIDWFPCPYPSIVDQFNAIPCPGLPDALVDLPCPCSQGLGIFEAGLNFDQWGISEWATVLAGAYVAVSLFQDSSRAVSRVSRYRRRRKAA